MKTKFAVIQVIIAAFLFSAAKTTAQNLVAAQNNTDVFDEQTLREKMKNDGLVEPVINKLIEQRKQLEASGRKVIWSNVKKNPVTNALCSDMGVENGWGAWLGDLGTANTGSQTWTPPAIPPTAPNFSITTGTGIDPNTPSAGNPAIPYVCPDFGKHSIQIGETCMNGCVAEQLTYPLTITANDTNLVYAYAIVIEDAGHTPSEQPFVELCIYDSLGNSIPCGCFRYTGGPSMPGFYYVNGNGCGWAGTDQYKPWGVVGVNLSAYVGQTVTVVITNVDCAACGHWAYSYWDFSCGTVEPEYCPGQQITLCGPTDPLIAYTYQWSTGATTPCITVTPNPNDTFSLSVQQPSGCNFNLMYVPKDTCAATIYVSATSTPDTCSTGTGTATATVWNGTPPYTFLWSNGQTAQTATGLSAGTYTITVTDTNNLTATNTVVVGNSLSGVISSVTPVSCFGGNDGSATATVLGGISPITYSWNNGQTTQTATGLTAGNYTVTVTDVTGCSAVLTVPVPGAPMLNTNANYTPSSCFTCPDGSATTNVIGGTSPYTYLWSPGGQTTPNITGIFPGTYTICVTDANGCTSCNIVNVLFLGVNEISGSSVTLYPNPSSGNLFIDFGNRNFGKAEVSFSDVVGKILFETNIPARGKHPLRLSGIQNGIYFVKIKTDLETVIKKIVIAH